MPLSPPVLLFLLLLPLLFPVLSLPSASPPPPSDGSVCYNGCSGHGTCVDYTCECFPGYHGEDCRTDFKDRDHLILSAGDFNLRRANFTRETRRHDVMLVGFSSFACARCITAEPDYHRAAASLRGLGVAFGRVDVGKERVLAEDYPMSIPSLMLFKRGRPFNYEGFHTSAAIVAFVRKQLAPPVLRLDSADAVDAFVRGPAGGAASAQSGSPASSSTSSSSSPNPAAPPSYRPAAATVVVGFFASTDDEAYVFAVVSLYGCAVVQLYGCTVVQCTPVQLFSVRL